MKLSKAFGSVFSAGSFPTAPTIPTATHGARGVTGSSQRNDGAGERNRKLVGPERYRTFDDMVANLAVVAGGLRLFLDLFAGSRWTMKAPEGSGAEGDKLAELATETILTGTVTPWAQIVRWLGGFRFYDFRLGEWALARRASGAWGLLDVEPRPNHTITDWITDERGKLLGVVQTLPSSATMVPLPIGQLIHIADNTLVQLPQGQGLLRHIMDDGAALRRLIELERVGYENTMEGTPVGWAPLARLERTPDKGAGAIAGLDALLKNHVIKRNRGIMLDSAVYESADKTPSSVKQWGLEVMRAEGTGQADLARAITRTATWISIVLGTEHLMLGGDKGAYNLSEDKSNRLGALVNSTLGDAAGAVNRYLIEPVMIANGKRDRRKWPTAIPSDVSQLDVERATIALLRLAQAGETIGAPTHDPAADAIRERVGLPKRPDPRPEDLIPAPMPTPASPEQPLAGDPAAAAKPEPAAKPTRATRGAPPPTPAK